MLKGTAVQAGVAIGKALLVGRQRRLVRERPIDPAKTDDELARFDRAVAESRTQLEALSERVEMAIGEEHAAIFEGHVALLSDPAVLAQVRRRIRDQQQNAEFAYESVVNGFCKALEQVEDADISSRVADLRDVSNRVIRNLTGYESIDLSSLGEPCIIVAEDLSPSDTAGIDRSNVLGFVTIIGSRTSHTAIMARAMELPAVVGVSRGMEIIESGDLLILDGGLGNVIVNPSEDQLQEARERQLLRLKWLETVRSEAWLPAETVDGYHVRLAANIELPEEVQAVKQNYGVGIGLFRTEFLFIKRSAAVDEETQYAAYRQVVEEIYPKSVIFRTLDIGGDKFLSHLDLPLEMNPFLGMRAIRFCFTRPDFFKAQLRAILRASAHGKVRIMFPMVTTLEELHQALAILDEVKAELAATGRPHNPHLDVGIMIEVPSAAIIADKLAPHVDFFSVGTNDLVQYAMAVDRSNPDLSYLYQPGNPAIIRLLKQVSDAAYAHGKWVGICGEMASEPLLAPLVLGLGIHELSMSPVSIPLIKRLVRHIRMRDAELLVAEAMDCGTAMDVMNLCRDFIQRVAPDILRN